MPLDTSLNSLKKQSIIVLIIGYFTMDYAKDFYSSRTRLSTAPGQGFLQLQDKASYSSRTRLSLQMESDFFFLTKFNISSVFSIKDTLLSCNPSGLHSQKPRPGAVGRLDYARCTIDRNFDV